MKLVLWYKDGRSVEIVMQPEAERPRFVMFGMRSIKYAYLFKQRDGNADEYDEC